MAAGDTVTRKEKIMRDPRTTIAGIVAGIAILSRTFGLEIPSEVTDGIIAVAVFFLGFFAKQAD